MIFATTASSIEGYQIVAYKGTVQGATFEDLLNNTEALGANAVLNICYDNAVSTDTLFHGSAVVIHHVGCYPELSHPNLSRGARDNSDLSHGGPWLGTVAALPWQKGYETTGFR